MPDPSPLAIAKAFAALCEALPGIKRAFHYEPEEINVKNMPAVSMLARRVGQLDRFTGPATENLWTWAVYLHVAVGQRIAGSDFQASQESLYTLVPLVLGAQRGDPSIGGHALRSEIEDLGETPTLDVDPETNTGELLKVLELKAWTEEI